MYFSLQIPFLLSELSFEHALYEFQGCQKPPKQKKRVPSIHREWLAPSLIINVNIVFNEDPLLLDPTVSTLEDNLKDLSTKVDNIIVRRVEKLESVSHQSMHYPCGSVPWQMPQQPVLPTSSATSTTFPF